MPKDIDDVLKELNKQQKELTSIEHQFSKELDSITKSIANLNKEQKNISSKLDTVLDILNMLSIFIEEEDEAEEEDDDSYYDSNEGWLPETSEWDSEEDDV